LREEETMSEHELAEMRDELEGRLRVAHDLEARLRSGSVTVGEVAEISATIDEIERAALVAAGRVTEIKREFGGSNDA
jgi:hypothetical protein